MTNQEIQDRLDSQGRNWRERQALAMEEQAKADRQRVHDALRRAQRERAEDMSRLVFFAFLGVALAAGAVWVFLDTRTETRASIDKVAGQIREMRNTDLKDMTTSLAHG